MNERLNSVIQLIKLSKTEGIALEVGTRRITLHEFNTSDAFYTVVQELSKYQEIEVKADTNEDTYPKASDLLDTAPDSIEKLIVTWRFKGKSKKYSFNIFDTQDDALKSYQGKAAKVGYKISQDLYFVTEDETWMHENRGSIQDTKLPYIEAVQRVFDWFKLFSAVANVTPASSDSSNELIFVQKVEEQKVSSPHHLFAELPATIETLSNVPKVDERLNDIAFGNEHRPHREEQLSFLRMAIVSFLIKATNQGIVEKDKVSDFVCANFKHITHRFYENYWTFLENFSATKFIKELEDSKLEYINKINTAISDAQTKAFAIPAAFIAIALLSRVSSVAAVVFIFFSAAISTYITGLIIDSQTSQLKNIHKSVISYFTRVKYEDEYQSKRIEKRVNRAKSNLKNKVKKNLKTLACIKCLTFAPLIAALLYVIWFIGFSESSRVDKPSSPSVIFVIDS